MAEIAGLVSKQVRPINDLDSRNVVTKTSLVQSGYVLQPGRLQHLSESCQQQSAVCCLSTKGQPWQSLLGLYIGDSLDETSLQCE